MNLNIHFFLVGHWRYWFY